MTNDGENNSTADLTANGRLEYINNKLDEYEKTIGIPEHMSGTEVEKYLCLTQNELRKLDSRELGEAAYLCAKHAMYLQKCINRERATTTWANRTLDLYISDQAGKYGTYNWYERKMVAIKKDSYAEKLYKIQTWAQQRVDRLEHLSLGIQFISKTLLALRNEKVYA